MAGSSGSADTSDDTQVDNRGRTRSVDHQDDINRLEDVESQSRYEEETADRGMGALHHIRSRTRSRTNEVLIDWAYNDPENPVNWPDSKKAFASAVTIMLVLNSTMGSALPSMAVPRITEHFGVTSQEQKVLPISVYLIGYVFGPIIWSPLSEHWGRRNLCFTTFIAFLAFTLACGFAPNWPSLLVFRLFCGLFGGSPIGVVAGILADMYGDPKSRGRAYSIFMVATVFGPLCAPIVSGYCAETIGWRWTFYVASIFAGMTLITNFFLPETFAPILLSRRAKKMRKNDTSCRAIAPRDLETTDMNQLVTVILARPLKMLFYEPIVAAICAYLALAYTIFYMSFQAFPIIFGDLYGLSPGVTGLCFLPIGGGSILALPVFWGWEAVLERARAANKAWVRREESRRLPLAVIGGPAFVISLFWLGWMARTSIPFYAPMMAGIFFGFGFTLIFMALLNYLTDAYDIYAASANAVASMCRSIVAVVLPLATTHMFKDLGISGACSLLGGLSAGMCLIPFIFLWKGPDIRAKSKFCIALRERREELARRTEEERLRLERVAEAEKEEVV